MSEIKNKKFKLVTCCPNNPQLKELLPGTKVIYSGHVYIKVNRAEIGAGLHLRCNSGHSVLLNPIYGTLREVKATERVEVVEFCEEQLEMYLVPSDKMGQYLR